MGAACAPPGLWKKMILNIIYHSAKMFLVAHAGVI